jgi:hypothetical protein
MKDPRYAEIAHRQSRRRLQITCPRFARDIEVRGTDHRRDEGPRSEARTRARGNGDAIAQYGHLIRDLEDLPKSMRNEEDGHALPFEASDGCEQTFHFIVAQ